MTIDTATTGSVRISAADPVYGEILDFLIDEADLLDRDLHNEWLALLAADIVYKMPNRKTLYRRDGAGFSDRASRFDDNMGTLWARVQRSVEVVSAWDRDPAPRVRRLVSNVKVHEGHTRDEYKVSSSIVALHNRFDTDSQILSARRDDVVRRTPDGLRLAQRIIWVDQALVPSVFLNVFM
jgi:3-phenylpropionate/cinnamic acid dioxygenase small subunit